MAGLCRLSLNRFGQLFRSRTNFKTQKTARFVAAWNKDWKPGPYPITPEEREAAAKKYGLRPEDYQPYPDDGFGYGDYPNLPLVSIASRDPYADWDMPEQKRNYGEPLPVDFDIIREDCWDPNRHRPVSDAYMIGWFLSVVGGATLIYYLFEPYPSHNCIMPKQYPKDGPHYVFEPVE